MLLDIVRLERLTLPIAIGTAGARFNPEWAHRSKLRIMRCFFDFTMNCCYILYSKKTEGFYVGCTHSDLFARVAKHNLHEYGTHRYTARTDDREIYFVIECETYSQAVNIERHVKRMKSRVYFENLLKYPEISAKLKLKYS